MSKSNYEMLVEQYKFKDEDALREITVENGYTDEAEQAAKDVLASDRKEYHELKKREEDREIFEEKLSQDRFSNPLYEDIHQMAMDVRFIKNIFIASIIIAVIVGIFLGLKISDIASVIGS